MNEEGGKSLGRYGNYVARPDQLLDGRWYTWLVRWDPSVWVDEDGDFDIAPIGTILAMRPPRRSRKRAEQDARELLAEVRERDRRALEAEFVA